jgi:hypothetical protein
LLHEEEDSRSSETQRGQEKATSISGVNCAHIGGREARTLFFLCETVVSSTGGFFIERGCLSRVDIGNKQKTIGPCILEVALAPLVSDD